MRYLLVIEPGADVRRNANITAAAGTHSLKIRHPAEREGCPPGGLRAGISAMQAKSPSCKVSTSMLRAVLSPILKSHADGEPRSEYLELTLPQATSVQNQSICTLGRMETMVGGLPR